MMIVLIDLSNGTECYEADWVPQLPNVYEEIADPLLVDDILNKNPNTGLFMYKIC